MTIALAFDIYGTLIDPHGVVEELSKHVGGRAQEFSNIWRDKQLEYTWRRGLMQRYENFPVCTRQALDYTDILLQTNLDESAKAALMQVYRVLPAYEDVPASLQVLADAGFRLFGFSNGVADAISGLLEHAGIDQYFDGVVSVDALQTFKPDPVVYHHFIEVADTEAENCWLVSSNGFDVIGAVSAGMKAAWLQRSSAVVFDPWEIEPSLVIHRLDELAQKILPKIQ
jgi:2-haloacid dehalogenase